MLVITAGVFEETLYRGYGIERLSKYFGGKYVAAAISLALFTLAHASAVGAAALLPILIVASLVTMLYLWRRDLLLNRIDLKAVGMRLPIGLVELRGRDRARAQELLLTPALAAGKSDRVGSIGEVGSLLAISR